MVVELTIGDGKPAQKTLQYRAIKDKAIQSDFVYLDNVAFTPKFFRKFLERSGAFEDERSNAAIYRIACEKFNQSEKAYIRAAWNSLQNGKTAMAKVKVRSDEPWAGAGTGLGQSCEATQESLETMIKDVLASQFSSDVRAFKKLKGITEDFGVMLMPLVCATPSVNYLNYLGKFNGRAIVQYTWGTGTKVSVTATFTGSINAIQFPDFDRRISKLLELGGNCYLEAIQNEASASHGWTIVQYSPYSLPQVQKPVIEPGKLLLKTHTVIGAGLAETNGIMHLRHKAKYEVQKFNATNKGHLFFAELSHLGDFKAIPLDHYSNAGAILVSVHETENHPFSHVGGFMRELNIPLLVTERSFNNSYHEIEKKLCANADARLLVYANEFANEGSISANVSLK